MCTLHPDVRRIEATPDPDGERLASSLATEYLDVRLRLARVLLRIARGGTFHLTGCSSAVQYAVRLGIPAPEAARLLELARALDAPAETLAPTGSASVEERIRAGALSVENAMLVGKLLHQPGLVRPEDDWLGRAQTLRTPELRRKVQERLEEAACGETGLVPLSFVVPERVRDEFARARDLASREARCVLTEGQAFTLIVRRFLDASDELRRGEGTRRVGPTAERPGERYVPASVRRSVLRRSEDRCEVPGCPHRIYLEYAHVVAHAANGDREEANLLRLCHTHHVQFDAGVLVLDGWRDARPVFRDLNGREIQARPFPPEGMNALDADDEADIAETLGVPLDFLDASYGEDEQDARRREGPMQVSERPPPAWAAG